MSYLINSYIISTYTWSLIPTYSTLSGRRRKRRDASQSSEEGTCYLQYSSFPRGSNTQLFGMATEEYPDEDPRGQCVEVCDSHDMAYAALLMYEVSVSP